MAAVILDTFDRADTSSGLGTSSSGAVWAGDTSRFRILANVATGLETADGFWYAYLPVAGVTGVTSLTTAEVSVPVTNYRVGVAYLGANVSQEALVAGVFHNGGGESDTAYLTAASDTLPDISLTAPIPNPGTAFTLGLLQVINGDGTATIHLLIDGESVLRTTVSATLLAEWSGANRVGIHLAEQDGINDPTQVTFNNLSYDLAPNTTPPAAGLLDTFDRADAGDLGAASGGLTWQGDALDFAIITNQAAPDAVTVKRAWLDTSVTLIPQDDQEIIADVEIPVIPTGDFLVGIELHGQTEIDNRVTLQVGRVASQPEAYLTVVDGTTTRLNSTTALVLAAGTLQLRMLTQNNQRLLRAYLAEALVFEAQVSADLTTGLDAGVQVGLVFDGTHADTSAARYDALRAEILNVPQLLVDDVYPMHAPPSTATSIYQTYTAVNIFDQPYIEYPVNSTTSDFKTAETTDVLEQDTLQGPVTAWNTYYSRFQRIAPMATFYEIPVYVPPDVPPEAEPREETFSNRAGIRIEVWDKDAPNTNLLAVMARSRNRRWFEALNEPGGGSFEIHLDDPVLYDHPDIEADGLNPRDTILKYGNIVRCYLDGAAVFSFKIENLRVTRVGSGEKNDQWVEVSGRGVLALLEDAVVYPEYGFQPKSRGDQRLFTFVANEYESVIDDGSGLGYENFGWAFAAELKAQFDVQTSPWIAAPVDWPEIGQNALWIWDQVRGGSRTSPAPIGYVYFLKRFFIDSDEDIAFFGACDDAFEAYLDGQPLMSNGGTYAFRETTRVDLNVKAGHHLIAVRCENQERPYGESPAGFVFAAAAIGTTDTRATNEKSTVVHNHTAGTFTLTFDGQTTSALPYNATRFDISAALEALSNVNPGDVYVSQIIDPGGYYVRPGETVPSGTNTYRTTIEWLGQYRVTNVPDLTANFGSLTGGDTAQVNIQQGGLVTTVEPAELVVLSDGTWRVLGYPEQNATARFSPPAFPPGAVMRFLLEEARARGVQYADDIIRLHTDYRDNDGEEFGIVVDTAFDIGMDLLQVAQRLSETSVDIYMSPWLELSMWVERGARKDQAGSDPYVEIREAKNLTRAAYDDRGIIRNSLLLRTADGWQERRIPESEEVWGRREAFLSLGNAPSDEQVGRTVEYAFSLTAQPNSNTVFEMPDTQKVQDESRPYKDFEVGDWIVAPDMHGTRRSRRVVGIGVGEDENGEVTYSIEMSNPRDEYERRLERWLESIQLGTLRGAIASARGVDPGASRVANTQLA